MRCRGSVSTILAILTLATGTSAHAAFRHLSLGVQGNWGDDTDLGLGARAILDCGFFLRGVEFIGSFDYFFPGEEFGLQRDYWEINTNVVYRIDTKRQAAPYAGAGFNVARRQVSTRVLDVDVSGYETKNGVNLLGGLTVKVGRPELFLEGKIEVEGGRQFVVSLGARY